jgi:hypothetical protein
MYSLISIPIHNSPTSVFSPASRPLDDVRFQRKFAPEAHPRSSFRDLANDQRSWGQCLGLEHPALAHSPHRFRGAFSAQVSRPTPVLSIRVSQSTQALPTEACTSIVFRATKLPQNNNIRVYLEFSLATLGTLRTWVSCCFPELGQGCPCFQIRHGEAFGRIRIAKIWKSKQSPQKKELSGKMEISRKYGVSYLVPPLLTI